MKKKTEAQAVKRKTLILPVSVWAEISGYRRGFERIPSEAEAIRQLIQAGLDGARNKTATP